MERLSCRLIEQQRAVSILGMTGSMKHLWPMQKPRFIAIVGGSGAGKTWLADRLQKALGKEAARISLDDFYLDRSHLSQVTRARINFDHPRAIDWRAFETVLRRCARGKIVKVPQYDFATHSRKNTGCVLKPKPFIIVDGLWLLRRPAVRRLFDFTIFLDSPEKLRLERRLARDCAERGRDEASVKLQFSDAVAPMHECFVAPQKRRAGIVFSQPPTNHDVAGLVKQLREHRL
jgi:uridine kinase